MKTLLAIALSVALSGCAGVGDTWVPMIDQRGPDQSKTYADLAECQGYASQAAGPGSGAMAGGAVSGVADQQSIIRKCMFGRGYSVLD